MVKIHFLNVGHGDCSIIEHHSGRITMIDINNSQILDDDSDREIAESYKISGLNYLIQKSASLNYLSEAGYSISLADPVEYYKANIGTKSIFRYIQTHPDIDHMRGLKRLSQEGIKILNFWDTDHNKKTVDFKNDDDEEHWDEYLQLRSDKSVTVLNCFRETKNKYFNMDDDGTSGDNLWILAPTKELKDTANNNSDINGHSYVLWFEYAGIKVIFGGDATETVWESIYNKYGKNVKCNVLKASHHGRDSGYYQSAVEAMSPEYTIVSVGKKPESDASNKYRNYCDNVWSTRWKGNIRLEIYDDGSAKIFSDR